MSFKILNNLIGLSGLVLILLVFSSYLCMTDMDIPSPTINQQNIAIHRIMEEIRRFHISHHVNDALNT